MSNRFFNFLLASTALIPLGSLPALANPLGAQATGGSVTVQGQGTANVTVNQTTDKAILNWQTFNVGTGETTQFVQPGPSSVTLNRVIGGFGPSNIDGTVTANGQVFLVNRDGILIGSGARIDAAGFLGTTNDIRDSDFMAGNDAFTIAGRPDASIVNEGKITARSGGFAALVAPGVRNSGTITATLGTVGLTAANGFTLDFYGDRLITLNVSDSIAADVKDVATGQSLGALVENEGRIKANGGRVQLTAVAARKIVNSVINNTGIIEADTINSRGGMIVLGAATAATKPAGTPVQKVVVSGTLRAKGKAKGAKGGTIVVSGESIQLVSANLDASGWGGGGHVLVGGDVGGGKSNPAVSGISEATLEAFAVPTATNVSVDAGSTINVSATDGGNGGKAVVWADGSTIFDGTILANAGPLSGDGGFVETSGHQSLAVTGIVDVGASNGASGTWLLDPTDVTIGATGTSVVTPSSIESALASGNVVVSTAAAGTDAGDITVAQDVSWANGNTLTLSANRNITVDDGVTIANTAAGSLNLRADSTGSGVGTVNFFGSGKVDFSQSTGSVSIFYNAPFNAPDGLVNSVSYTSQIDYSNNVLTNSTIPNQFIAYMLVNDVADLQNIENNLSGDYALGTDVDASATADWNAGTGLAPIGNVNTPFTGEFDGDGHIINDLTIGYASPMGPADIGLFGDVVGTGFDGGIAAIRNVGLTNINIDVTSGAGNVGALVGAALGPSLITNSYSTGTLTVSGGGGAVGGLVGLMDDKAFVANSRSSASVSISDGNFDSAGGLVGTIGPNLDLNGSPTSTPSVAGSYATGAITNTGSVFAGIGGLVGSTFGQITQSYATGQVIGGFSLYGIGGLVGANRGTSINQSYATGSVTGTTVNGIGGLVGSNLSTTFGAYIVDSYSTGNVSGTITPEYISDEGDVLSAVGGKGGIGGLAGTNTGSIQTSYAAGNVIGNSADTGGLVGNVYLPGPSINSYWDTQSSGQTGGGGGEGLSTAQFKSGLPAGFDSTVWAIDPAGKINNGYPYLLWQTAIPPAAAPTVTLTGSPVSPSPPQTTSITVEALDETKTYGGPDPALTYQIVSGSLSGSVTFSGSLARAAGENVGSYAIDEGTLSLPSNYSLTFDSGAVFSITPATLTYVANPLSRTYGALNPSLSGTVTGFVNGDSVASATTGTLAFTTAATAASNVGSYAVTGSGLTADFGNYTFVQAAANSTALQVTQAPLTITADNQSKTYGSTLDLGTTAFSESGQLFNGDAVTGVTLASAGATAAASIAGSPYPIVPSNASGSGLANYHVGYVDGALTVTQLPTDEFSNGQNANSVSESNLQPIEITSSPAAQLATVLTNDFVQEYGNFGQDILSQEQAVLIQELTTILAQTLPASIIGNPTAVAALQQDMVAELNNQLNKSLTPNILGGFVLQTIVDIASTVLADSTADFIEQKYNIPPTSWIVPVVKLWVQIGVEDAYTAVHGGETTVATGGLNVVATTAQVALSQIVQSIEETRGVYASTEVSFEVGQQLDEQLLVEADAVQTSNPTRAEALRAMAGNDQATRNAFEHPTLLQNIDRYNPFD